MEVGALSDAQVFERLYFEYHELVRAIAFRIVFNDIEAEDVAQSIFLKLWERPERFPGGNFESWLTTVTKNHCIDLLRRRKRRRETAIFENSECARTVVTLEDEILRSLEVGWAMEALWELPVKQRQPIIEAFYSGLSHYRIAESMQLPLGTVKSRIRDGIRRLRRKASSVV